MREIKFRGYHFQKGYGDGYMGQIDSFRINKDGSKTWNCLEKGNEGGWQPLVTGSKSMEDGEVIVQFTGIKDKNGKDIYEGDIVALDWNNNYKGEIYWDIGFWGIKWNKEAKAYNYRALVFEKNSFIRIGNIYENPELIK